MRDKESADIMVRIGEAVTLDYAGERSAAGARLEALWEEIKTAGSGIHRCMLAHYMADMQDDPRAELLWDLRALQAADSVDSGGLQECYPSLHLNLADDYRKLGDLRSAREHLSTAAELAEGLPENGYAKNDSPRYRPFGRPAGTRVMSTSRTVPQRYAVISDNEPPQRNRARRRGCQRSGRFDLLRPAPRRQRIRQPRFAIERIRRGPVRWREASGIAGSPTLHLRT